MSGNDGAHDGLDAVAGAREAMGGDRPPGTVERTPEEMRLFLLAAPEPPFETEDDAGTASDRGYLDASRYVGKRILAVLDEHPELLDEPTEIEYDWSGDPDGGSRGMKPEFLRARGWPRILDEEYGITFRGLGLSGYQWGWGVNAARFCVGADYAGNPAIVEIDA